MIETDVRNNILEKMEILMIKHTELVKRRENKMELEEMEELSPAFMELGNSNLGPHKLLSTKREHFAIRRELRRLGLRKKTGMYRPEEL